MDGALMRCLLILLAMMLLPASSFAWGPVATMTGWNLVPITLTALPAGTGSVIIARASDNATLATLTAAGQTVSVLPGTVVYAKTSQAESWAAVSGEDYNGYMVTMTGATDGRQSLDAATTAFNSGWGGPLTGSAVCQTGNATAMGSMSVAVVYVTGP